MLSVEHLDAHYGDLQVLWDLSLEVHQGELTALIGSNGSGKTTLLRVITGLIPSYPWSFDLQGYPSEQTDTP